MVKFDLEWFPKEFVYKVFCYLAKCEARKIVNYEEDLQLGLQDGYISCLVDLFGADEDAFESSILMGNNYMDIVEGITRTKEVQKFLKEVVAKSHSVTLDDFININKIVEQATYQYLDENYEKAYQSLNCLA